MVFRLRSIPQRKFALCVLISVALLAAAGSSLAKKPSSPDDLFNPFLGVDYSYWLPGPSAISASEAKPQPSLALQTDDAAKSFIKEFGKNRTAGTDPFKKTPRQLSEQRAAEADRRFTERAYPGRRTDRGGIFVV